MEKPSNFIKRHLKMIITVLVVVVVAAYFVAETAKHQRPVQKNADTGVENAFLRFPVVKLVEVQPREMTEERAFTGFAKEGKTSRIAFRVAGPVSKLDVVIGKRVAEGTVLAEIDARDYTLAVARVNAALAEAHAALRAMKTGARAEDIASLESQLSAAESAYETAEKNFERFKSLLESQSASQAQYDLAKTQFDAAKSARDTAQQQLDKGKRGAREEEIEAIEAKIHGLEVSLQAAENALADTKLVAPYDGYVSQKYVEAEEYVIPGSPILAFTEALTMNVDTTVPESVIVRQAEIVGYACQFEAYPGRRQPAELKELGLAMQAGKQGYPLEVTVQVPDGMAIHPGMAATVFVELKRENPPCFVPLSAIVGQGDLTVLTPEKDGSGAVKPPNSAPAETVVWTVDPADNTIQKRVVTILRILDDGVEIAGNIQPGDKIVGAGARFLSEGQKVRF